MYLSGLFLLWIARVGVEGPQYLHGLIVLGLSSQHFFKTLGRVFHVAASNVHLTKAKVRKNVATVGKLGGLRERKEKERGDIT